MRRALLDKFGPVCDDVPADPHVSDVVSWGTPIPFRREEAVKVSKKSSRPDNTVCDALADCARLGPCGSIRCDECHTPCRNSRLSVCVLRIIKSTFMPSVFVPLYKYPRMGVPHDDLLVLPFVLSSGRARPVDQVCGTSFGQIQLVRDKFIGWCRGKGNDLVLFFVDRDHDRPACGPHVWDASVDELFNKRHVNGWPVHDSVSEQLGPVVDLMRLRDEEASFIEVPRVFYIPGSQLKSGFASECGHVVSDGMTTTPPRSCSYLRVLCFVGKFSMRVHCADEKSAVLWDSAFGGESSCRLCTDGESSWFCHYPERVMVIGWVQADFD